MQSGRRLRVAGFNADNQPRQRNHPPIPPLVEQPLDDWADYTPEPANGFDSPRHLHPRQTFHESPQQPNAHNGDTAATRPLAASHGFAPPPSLHQTPHQSTLQRFDRSSPFGYSPHPLVPLIQERLPYSSHAIHQNYYDSHGAAAYRIPTQITNLDDISPYDEPFDFDQPAQHSLQSAAFGDRSQRADFDNPPPYSPGGFDQLMQQPFSDDGNIDSNPDIPIAQHGSISAPPASSPAYQCDQHYKLDCPVAAHVRVFQPRGAQRHSRLKCFQPEFPGMKDFSHVKEHLRKAHGIVHPICRCFLKDRKDLYTNHSRDGCSSLKPGSQATPGLYAIRSKDAILRITSKAQVSSVGRFQSREWYENQEACWKSLFDAIYRDYDFDQPGAITPCKLHDDPVYSYIILTIIYQTWRQTRTPRLVWHRISPLMRLQSTMRSSMNKACSLMPARKRLLLPVPKYTVHARFGLIFIKAQSSL